MLIDTLQRTHSNGLRILHLKFQIIFIKNGSSRKKTTGKSENYETLKREEVLQNLKSKQVLATMEIGM